MNQKIVYAIVLIVFIAGGIGLYFFNKTETTSYEPWIGAEWVDDYYVVGKLNDQTYAISEPTVKDYYNTNYLIVGNRMAILFDTGYKRDILPVVRRLTDLPILTLYSHFHFDHTGFIEKQSSIGMISLPYLRQRAEGNRIKILFKEYLSFGSPIITVAKWIEPDEIIDLGGRQIQVLHTPGHSPESISLLDEKNKQIFTGDLFFDPEWDYVGLHPTFNFGLSIKTARKLKLTLNDSYLLNGGHGSPRQPFSTIDKFINLLTAVKDGTLHPTIVFKYGSLLKRYELDGMKIMYSLYGKTVLSQWIINIVVIMSLSFLILFILWINIYKTDIRHP